MSPFFSETPAHNVGVSADGALVVRPPFPLDVIGLEPSLVVHIGPGHLWRPSPKILRAARLFQTNRLCIVLTDGLQPGESQVDLRSAGQPAIQFVTRRVQWALRRSSPWTMAIPNFFNNLATMSQMFTDKSPNALHWTYLAGPEEKKREGRSRDNS